MSKRTVKVTETELNEHFEAVLFPKVECDCEERETLNEDLTPSDKNDVKTMVRKEIRDFLKMTRSDSFDATVKQMTKEYIKNDKDLEKYFVEISKNVLIQLYKSLYTRRSFWASDLKNKSN